jgi:hypothetical protein
VPHASEAHFRLIEKRHGLEVPLETVPGFEPAPPPENPADHTDTSVAPNNGGIKGKRPSKKDKLRALASKQT